MSLPIAGGSRRPTRSATHTSLDHQKMMKLGLEVEETADEQPISCDAIDELALELGVDPGDLYASAAVTTDVEIARERDVAFVVCGGICQNWGALECLEVLADTRRNRLDEDRPVFDIFAKSCLDRCEHAPAVQVHTPDGSALIEQATPAKLREAIAQTCD